MAFNASANSLAALLSRADYIRAGAQTLAYVDTGRISIGLLATVNADGGWVPVALRVI